MQLQGLRLEIEPTTKYYIFNIPLYFIGITTRIYTKPVAQSAERWSRDPGSWVQFPVGGFGVAFSSTGPGWVVLYLCEFTFKTIDRLCFHLCLSV